MAHEHLVCVNALYTWKMDSDPDVKALIQNPVRLYGTCDVMVAHIVMHFQVSVQVHTDLKPGSPRSATWQYLPSSSEQRAVVLHVDLVLFIPTSPAAGWHKLLQSKP